MWDTKMDKTWKMKDFIIITNAQENSTVLSIISKKKFKGSKILKRLKTRRLPLKNCILPWKHSIVINAFFLQGMSEESLHDLMRDSKDLELKTIVKECSLSVQFPNLIVKRIRCNGLLTEIPPKIFVNKIIVNRIPEVL